METFQLKSHFISSLAAGAAAGTAVDTILFPLDTIKTRLQSSKGFKVSGGFQGVYRGLSSAIIGSAPSASLFFCTYDTMKYQLKSLSSGDAPILSLGSIHMISASCGEIAACFVRVPTEIIKQRLQTGLYRDYRQAVSTIFKLEGVLGFYQGFFTTVLREIPFTCIQFPLYEYLKTTWADQTSQSRIPLWPAALCGSVSGGTAALITTPCDVTKTRIMLSSKTLEGPQYKGFATTLARIAKEEGYNALFKGAIPRVMWMSFGGAIFLGTYEMVIHFSLTNHNTLSKVR